MDLKIQWNKNSLIDFGKNISDQVTKMRKQMKSMDLNLINCKVKENALFHLHEMKV